MKHLLLRAKINLFIAAIFLAGLSLILTQTKKVEAAAPLKGLVGYWTMDNNEVSGRTYYDKSGFNNYGTGPTTNLPGIPGVVRQGRNFTGNPNAITITTTMTPTNGTISAWIRSTNTGTYSIVGTNGVAPELRLRSGQIYCYSNITGTPAVSTRIINNGLWHHVACTWKGTSSLKVFIDSIPDGSATPTTTPAAISTLYIGNGGDLNNFYFLGDIDEVRLYNRDLSQAEISGLYTDVARTVPTAEPIHNLVGYWTMDNNDINSGPIGATSTIYDKSGYGKNGTIQGTTITPGKIKQALIFDGPSNDFIDLGSNIYESADLANGSISTWVKTNATSDNVNTRTRNYVNLEDAIILGEDWITPANWPSCTAGGSARTQRQPINDGKWHNIVCTWGSGSGTILYVDGVFYSSSASYTAPDLNTPSKRNRIGNSVGSLYYNGGDSASGTIDEVRIYNYGLTQAEVKQLYNGKNIALAYPDGPVKGLTGYYTMDNADTNGSTVYDKSGTGRNGKLDTTNNEVTSIPGKIKQAARFDAVQTQTPFIITNPASASELTNFTFSAWIRTTSTNERGGLWWGQDGNSDSAFVRVGTTGGVECNTNNIANTRALSTLKVNDNQWHHVVCTWVDASSIKVYVDSILSGTATPTSTLTANNTTEEIGTAQVIADGNGVRPSGLYKGDMDEVRIYNRAISQTEVSQLYSAARTLKIR